MAAPANAVHLPGALGFDPTSSEPQDERALLQASEVDDHAKGTLSTSRYCPSPHVAAIASDSQLTKERMDGLCRLLQELQDQQEIRFRKLLQTHEHNIVEAVRQGVVQEFDKKLDAEKQRATSLASEGSQSNTQKNDVAASYAVITAGSAASAPSEKDADAGLSSWHSLPELNSPERKPPSAVSFDSVEPVEELLAEHKNGRPESRLGQSSASPTSLRSSKSRHSQLQHQSSWNTLKDAKGFNDNHESLKAQLYKSGTSNLAALTGSNYNPIAVIRVFTKSRVFEISVCVAIMVNGLFIGVVADWSMQNPGGKSPIGFRIIELFFLVFFSLELSSRILSEGAGFCWFGRNFRWNMFDSVLVSLGLVEEIAAVFAGDAPNVGAFRILRMLRVLRVFRIMRLFRFFKQLRVMVSGIVNSLYSLMWALILLICMKFIFAMFILQFAAIENDAQASGTGDLSPKDVASLVLYFGSLYKTMFTLFLAISGGLDWGDAAMPLSHIHVSLGLLFALYISFAVLCVLNIVTGVFVESAKQITRADEDFVLMEQLESREKWFEEVKDIFESADADSSGKLNGEEFTEQIKTDARLQAQLRKIGVQVEAYSANGLFQLLDFDGSGELDLDEFCLALQAVNGGARSIDIAKLQYDNRLIRGQVADLIDHVEHLVEVFYEHFGDGGLKGK